MTKRAASSDTAVTRSDTDATALQHYLFPESGRAIWAATAVEATEILNKEQEEPAVTDKPGKDGDGN